MQCALRPGIPDRGCPPRARVSLVHARSRRLTNARTRAFRNRGPEIVVRITRHRCGEISSSRRRRRNIKIRIKRRRSVGERALRTRGSAGLHAAPGAAIRVQSQIKDGGGERQGDWYPNEMEKFKRRSSDGPKNDSIVALDKTTLIVGQRHT